MSVQISNTGFTSNTGTLIFSGGTTQFKFKEDLLEATNYYVKDATVFKKNSSFLFKKIAFRVTGAGTYQFNLFTDSGSGSGILLEHKSIGYTAAIIQLNSEGKVSFTITIARSNLGATSTLGISEKNAFLSGTALSTSSYSLSNKPPIVNTTLPSGVTTGISNGILNITTTITSSNYIYLDIWVKIS